MIGVNRRRVMGGEKEKEKLIYHWSGEDELVNSAWVDRIQGFPFAKEGNPIHENNGYTCAAANGFFKANLNTDVANNGTVGIHLGNRWHIVVDCKPLELRTFNMNLIIDFGSLTASYKSFGFGISGAGGQDRLIDNYKSTGDSQAYSVATSRSASVVVAPAIETRGIIEYGCEQYGNKDAQYIMYNGVKQVATTPHDPISFEANFNISSGYFGSGYTSGYAIVKVAIFDIKIYNCD